MDIELALEGIPDRAIANAIRKRVRALRGQFAHPGSWRVTIAPSETRGEWDLGVQIRSEWQLHSFTDSLDRLPDVVERKLRELLTLPTPGVSTKG